MSFRKLIIEIDGDIHKSRKDYDDSRAEILQGIGLRLVRLKNEDVIFNWEFIAKDLLEELQVTI